MKLTREQSDSFFENGYLPYGKILNDDELAELRVEYDRLFEEARNDGRYRNLAHDDTKDNDAKKTAPKQMLQIMQVCERSLKFRKLLYDSRFLDIVQDIIGPNIMLFHDQALFKPAHHGGPVYWHQDNAYWKCRPANLISCWLTLDDAVRENGAMQVIPGSHLKPVWHGATDTNALIQTKADADKAVVVELPAGACMFHHCQTLHYTQPNETDRQRRAFIMHYMTPGTINGHVDKIISVDFSHPMLRAGI